MYVLCFENSIWGKLLLTFNSLEFDISLPLPPNTHTCSCLMCEVLVRWEGRLRVNGFSKSERRSLGEDVCSILECMNVMVRIVTTTKGDCIQSPLVISLDSRSSFGKAPPFELRSIVLLSSERCWLQRQMLSSPGIQIPALMSSPCLEDLRTVRKVPGTIGKKLLHSTFRRKVIDLQSRNKP